VHPLSRPTPGAAVAAAASASHSTARAAGKAHACGSDFHRCGQAPLAESAVTQGRQTGVAGDSGATILAPAGMAAPAALCSSAGTAGAELGRHRHGERPSEGRRRL
jgi:hypothetical protein